MTSTDSRPADEAPPIGSRSDFAAAVSWVARRAVDRRSRRLVLVADQFGDWPLDDEDLLEAFGRFLHLPQRRLLLLGHEFDSLRQTHPRFVAWRRDWSHSLEAWKPPTEMGALPTMMVDDGSISLQLIDVVHWRGRAAVDPHRAHRLREQIDAFLQRSERAFPVHHLGL